MGSKVYYVDFKQKNVRKKVEVVSNNTIENLKPKLIEAIVCNNYQTLSSLLDKSKIYIDHYIEDPLGFALKHDVGYQLFVLILNHLSDSLEKLVKKYPYWGNTFIYAAINEDSGYLDLLTKHYMQETHHFKKTNQLSETEGHYSLLHFIIKKTNYFRDEEGNDALHRACMAFDKQLPLSKEKTAAEEANIDAFLKIEHFIHYSPDVNSCNKDGYTPIALAIENNSRFIIQRDILLKNKSFDLLFKNKQGENLLHLFCKNTSGTVTSLLKIIKSLLRAGIDINETNSMGQTPVFFLRTQFDFYILKFMHRCGASLAIIDNEGNSLLNIYQDLSLAKYVLSHSTLNTKFQNQIKENVFCSVSRALATEPDNVMEFFKQHGLNINSQLSNGSYPLLELLKHCPVTSRMIDMIKYMIIVYELDLHVIDAQGRNAAIIIAQNKQNSALNIISLIERGIIFYFNQVDYNRQNFLHHFFLHTEHFQACDSNDEKEALIALVSLLKNGHLDLEQKDKWHNIPLDYLQKSEVSWLMEAYEIGVKTEFVDTSSCKKYWQCMSIVNVNTGKAFTDFDFLDDLPFERIYKCFDMLYYLYSRLSKEDLAVIFESYVSPNFLSRTAKSINILRQDYRIIQAFYHCGARFSASYGFGGYEGVVEDLVECKANPLIFKEFQERKYIIKTIAVGIASDMVMPFKINFVKDLIKEAGKISYEEQHQFFFAALRSGMTCDFNYFLNKKLISTGLFNHGFGKWVNDHKLDFFMRSDPFKLSDAIKIFGDFLLDVDQAIKPTNHNHLSGKRYGALEYFCRYYISYTYTNWSHLFSLLIDNLGYDVNAYIEYTPLASLIEGCSSFDKVYTSIARYLIAAGADINLGSGPDNAPPIAITLIKGSDAFYELLTAGCCQANEERLQLLSNIRDQYSNQYSLDHDCQDMFEGKINLRHLEQESAFDKKIADIEGKDQNGNTPLLYALEHSDYASKGSWNLIKKFVDEQKPNLLAANKNGQNLLHIICDKKLDLTSEIYGEIIISIINQAIEQGIDINAKDKDNNTPCNFILDAHKDGFFNTISF